MMQKRIKKKNNCILKDKMETGLIQAGFFCFSWCPPTGGSSAILFQIYLITIFCEIVSRSSLTFKTYIPFGNLSVSKSTRLEPAFKLW